MTNTRRLSTIAILSAISFVLMYFDFPLLPAATFLKIEFSILPVLVGLVVMDLPAALGILLLRSLLKLLLNSQGVNTYIGLPMNVVALGVFVIAFGLIWKKERSTLRFLLASLAGTIGLTSAMLVLNYVYAVPLYAQFANFDIGKIIGLSNYLMTMVLPFNLIEGLIFAISFVLMYFDFPLLPAATFLKIEFSILPVLVGLVVMDLPAALGILLLRSLLKLLLNSQGVNTYIGLPMNIVALGVFVIAFGLIWKKERSTLRFLLASLAGTVGLTAAMLVLNYVYAVPLYAKFANFDIGKILGLSNYLMTMVLPFNLIEGVIFAVSFWLLYVLLKPTLKHYER